LQAREESKIFSYFFCTLAALFTDFREKDETIKTPLNAFEISFFGPCREDSFEQTFMNSEANEG
jgi:hypothetical protein